MSSYRKGFYSIGIALMVVSLLLAGCAPQAAPTAEAPTAAPPPTAVPPAPTAAPTATAAPIVVRVGMTPFFDYQFWAVAKEFGWDKELGLSDRVRARHGVSLRLLGFEPVATLADQYALVLRSGGWPSHPYLER